MNALVHGQATGPVIRPWLAVQAREPLGCGVQLVLGNTTGLPISRV